MKVLLVSEPGVDGVFRYVEALCHYLLGQGVEVHLAYSDRRACDCLPRLVARVEQHGGRTVNLRTANRPASADWRAFRALRRLARAVAPDVIHSHSSKAGCLARLLPLSGIRAAQFYNPHAYVGMRPVPGRLDWLYNGVERALGRTGHTIVLSTDERRFAAERLGIPSARLFLVRNGVDLGKFSPVSPERKRQLREALGLPIREPVLGFIGRTAAQKDPATLYRAFARAAAGTALTLFHVGQGELDRELDLLAGELGIRHRIVRCPYTATPAEFYRAVDGFILCSRYEGFSLAVLEALAANLPLILSRAPGNRDLLAQPLSHAWSADPGDVDGFALAIADWHRRLRNPSPINHRQIAKTQFDFRRTLGTVLSLYRDVLEAGRTRGSRPGRPWIRRLAPPRRSITPQPQASR
jgi:glycosyltransferase involved in cell wall biosynthesis